MKNIAFIYSELSQAAVPLKSWDNLGLSQEIDETSRSNDQMTPYCLNVLGQIG